VIVLGIFAAIAASALYNGGIILQALEARDQPREHALRASLLLRLARRRRWLAGTAMTLLGWPLQTLALLAAPLTVVQPALSIGLLLLLVVGARMPGERVGRAEVAGVAAIIGGVVVMGIVAPMDPPVTKPLDESATVLLSVLGVITVAPYLLRPFRPLGPAAIAATAGLAYGWGAIANKLVANGLSTGHWLAVLGWASATGVASLVAVSSEMTALQTRSATQVGPILFVMETLVPVLAAPVVANERFGHSTAESIVFGVGLVVVIVGAVLISRSPVVGHLIGLGKGRAVGPAPGMAAVDQSSEDLLVH
jgi:hypothetical protein